MRCNIWHVRGLNRDLIVDTGMGVASLATELADIVDKPVLAVATHGHDDHIGSHHEFDSVLVHPAEAAQLENPPLTSLDMVQAWGIEEVEGLARAGYEVTDSLFVRALPIGVELETFAQKPARVTRLIDEGHIIDLGDRQFEVLHLPGHSPGSIGLWEAATGTLFSGDAVYDGPLLDELHHSNVADYCTTMQRLLELPVNVVHGGHDPSFGRERLQQIARAYLDRRL
ncbi:MAG: MBL fold metallo-hydrolase [Acidimicrobiaceae bacterium]|nr:MBL fold metallo-hydrolase [Acidimicrobiaceae bacterium]MBT5581842.1 MBL fold metallo-hydrolase [Acidimicrobiaceae bacterium]MBT5850486.1 MBL fold metallo-hydrolase [Acidimicrobiaceae bacterium]